MVLNTTFYCLFTVFAIFSFTFKQSCLSYADLTSNASLFTNLIELEMIVWTSLSIFSFSCAFSDLSVPVHHHVNAFLPTQNPLLYSLFTVSNLPQTPLLPHGHYHIYVARRCPPPAFSVQPLNPQPHCPTLGVYVFIPFVREDLFGSWCPGERWNWGTLELPKKQ